jgi:kynurenine 3-monooxygenase
VKTADAAIIGGGLCGNLLAVCLARRGFSVEVFERRPKPAADSAAGGRSINLALAARGLEALRRFDALERIAALLLPMRGRMIHEPDAAPAFVPYGSAQECIYSVSRSALNFALYELAAELGVRFRFDSECTGLDAASGSPIINTAEQQIRVEADVVFAADGAGSAIRRSLASMGRVSAEESLLEHGYKELSIAAVQPGADVAAGPAFALEPEALHIWPRSEFMLIALANADKSFTATLFLSKHGSPGFDSIDPDQVESFFVAQFADALPHFDNLTSQYAHNAVGDLGTVRCTPWHAGNCLLIGDAAHAIVPFHGQGMNAAFEDVRELDEILAAGSGNGMIWPDLFAAFESQRMHNTNAIADMALENYLEMRSAVRDPRFLLQRHLALELERRFPNQFISQYAMVMFRPDIPYARAQQLGAIQARILGELTLDATALCDVDFDRAAVLVAELPRSD